MNTTIEPFKNRRIKYADEVWVYRNLTRGSKTIPVYSIKQNGRVVAHATSLLLSDCRFVVSKKGYERVRKTGHKNVHAYVVGKLEHEIAGEFSQRAYYNPRANYGPNFICVHDSQPLLMAEYVHLGTNGVTFQNGLAEGCLDD